MYAIPDLGPLLTPDDFEPHVGRSYLVNATPKPIEIQLDRVIRLRNTAGPNFREPFTLVFSTPFADLLIAGTYQMQAPGGGYIEVDLQPTQTAHGPRRFYHAVFT